MGRHQREVPRNRGRAGVAVASDQSHGDARRLLGRVGGGGGRGTGDSCARAVLRRDFDVVPVVVEAGGICGSLRVEVGISRGGTYEGSGAGGSAGGSDR